jgi:hypothetical protein
VAVAVAVAVAGVVVTAGCDPGPGGRLDEGGSVSVLEALEGVRYTGDPPPSVTVVDAERANALVAVDERRFWSVTDLGTPLLRDFDVPEHRYGLDPARAETATTVTTEDERGWHEYGIWTGDFDAAAITADLAANEFTERQAADGGALWVNESGDVRLRVSDDEITWGDEEFDRAVPTGGEPLSEEPRYRELSACVGEAYHVHFTDRGFDEEIVTAFAVGQVAESAGDSSELETSEVLCLVTNDEAGAERAADTLKQRIADKPDRYGGSEVSLLESEQPGVRVTIPHIHEGQEPGWLMREDLMLILEGLGARWP